MYSLRGTLSRIYAAAPRSLLFSSNLGQQGEDKLLRVACSSEARQQWCWSSEARPAARSSSWEPRPLRSIGTSTGQQGQNGTFYEFRTYIIQPGKVADFKKLTSDNIHLRTAHSQLIGYWSVEIGCLNEVFHLWKYGVYELVSYQMAPGGPAVWGKAFQKAVSAHSHVGYCTLVGVFHSEFGNLNKVHCLWWHEDADKRAAGRRRAHEDVRVVAAVRDSATYLVSQTNKLLRPMPYSPLK
ncbi:protein NipSnap homolog 3A isoform X3 [Scyliorhinus canicula]|uniref:protein NipSnap homolog 3A isoform X3 n=1 Tax=Scyliorhinus canicula TaxID=7830 RepID=UPI0018F31CB7|nr:protein NipSnap homolog 3A isoform X3 [Scyliorhinus canicula]